MTRRESAAAESGATRVAGALRSAPPALDEVTRARMERRLLDAPRDRVSGVAPRLDRRGRVAWAAGGALVAAAAALAIGWAVWPRGAEVGPEGPVARFTIDGPGEGATGEVRVGGSLEVGAGEQASVQVGHAEVALTGSGGVDRGGPRPRVDRSGADRGAVRFASLDARDVRLELTSGRVDVAFHPVERGRERLTIETRSARVEVVGTVFSVRIDDGATRVAVREGVVRVVPHGADGSAVMVRAGESVAVRDGGAARVERGESEVEAVAVAETGPEAETEAEAEAEVGTSAETVAGAELVRRGPLRGRAPGGEPAPVAVVAEPEVAEPDYAPAPAEVDRPVVVVVSARRRYEMAADQIARGQHAAGRQVLAELVADRSVPLAIRVEAQTLIGDSLQRQGDLAAAIVAFERTAVLGAGRPEGANAIMSIASVYGRQGRTDDARRTYLRYLEEYPRGPNGHDARAWICRHGGDPSVECEAR